MGNRKRIVNYSYESNGVTTQLVRSSGGLVTPSEQVPVIRARANGWYLKSECEINRITDLISFEPSQREVRRGKR